MGHNVFLTLQPSCLMVYTNPPAAGLGEGPVLGRKEMGQPHFTFKASMMETVSFLKSMSFIASYYHGLCLLITYRVLPWAIYLKAAGATEADLGSFTNEHLFRFFKIYAETSAVSCSLLDGKVLCMI